MSILVILTLPQLVLQKGVPDENGNAGFVSILTAWDNNKKALTKQLEADSNALLKINQLFADGQGTSDALAKTLQGTSQEFQDIAQSTNFSTVKLTNYVKQTQNAIQPIKYLGTQLKTLGATLLANAAQFGAWFAASKFIEWIVNLVDNYVNRVQYAQEAAEEINKSLEENAVVQKEAQQAVKDYGEEYINLRKGVNQATGENISLNADEFARYTELSNQLGSIFPGVVSGWDSSNNAILKNIDSVEKLNDVYERFAQNQRNNEQANFGTLINAGRMSLNEPQGTYQRVPTNMLQQAQEALEALASAESWEQFIRAGQNSVDVGIMGLDGGFSSVIDQYGGYAGVFNVALTEEGRTAMRDALQGYITNLTADLSSSVNEYYLPVFRNLLESAFSRFGGAGGTEGVGYELGAEAKAALNSVITQLPYDFLAGFGTGEQAVEGIQSWVETLVGAFTQPGAEDAITNYAKAMSAFAAGNSTYSQAVEARTALVNSLPGYMTTEMYDLIAPILRDSLGAVFDEYPALVNRAQEAIQGITQEQAQSLNKAQLDWLGSQTLGTEYSSLNDFLTQFTEYQNALSLSLETLQENWKTTQESQQKAVEALTAQEESQGRLSQENYDNLIGANRAYAGAVTTFDGQYQIDSAKLYDLMEAESRTLMESNAKGLEQSLADYQSALSELENLQRSGTEDQVAAQELVVDQLRKEVLDRKLLQQELQASTSALGRWQSAQDMAESGDVFRSLKSALEQITEGVETGRTNTNKYQASGDLLFGKDSAWRTWTDQMITQRVEQASKLYDKEGQLDNNELYRQMLQAGLVNKEGLFTKDWSIQNIADALGYGTEFVAQAIKAAQEYGDNILDFSSAELEKWLPKTETENNTAALQSNAEALNANTQAVGALTGAIAGTSGNVPQPATWGTGVEVEPVLDEDAEPMTLDPIAASVDLNTDAAMQKVSELNSAAGTPVQKNVVVNVVQGSIKDVPGGGGGGAFSETYLGAGAFASGTKNAPQGTALVGELGPEIIVDKKTGTWRLAEEPQLTKLSKGDIVFTAQETAKILKGAVAPLTGNSYAVGLNNKRLVSSFAMIAHDGTAYAPKPTSNRVTPSKNKNSGNGGGNGSSAPSLDDILDKLNGLYDWVERALEVAAKATQDIIDSVAEKIGAIGKNRAIEDALVKTAQEIALNEQGYAKYMETAGRVQRETGLSQELVNLIQNGAINIADYDDETKKKIEAYQEWFNKAEAVKETIEDLKEQQVELSRQKLDNIVNYYDLLKDRTDAAIASSESLRELMVATGKEITASDYAKDIALMNEQLEKLQEERYAYTTEMNRLMAAGYITADSDAWHEYTANLEDMDQAIMDININLANMKNEIAQINITNLQYALDAMQQTQSVIQAIMGFHDAQGTENTDADYESLIRNGMEQIQNLQAQNEELERQQEGLDVLSERYQELQAQINSNEQSIWDMKTAQEQWNDAIADLEIQKLQEEREALEKENEELQKKLDMEQALEDLAKARQRKKLIFRENVGFTYEADYKAIQEAQDRIDELRHQETLDKIDEAIEAIEENKKDDNVYDYTGTEQIKKYASGGVNTRTGLVQLDGTSSKPEVVFNATDAAKLYDLVHNSFDLNALRAESIGRLLEQQSTDKTLARNISVQIGDIRVYGVDDAEGLAKVLKQNLESAMLQALYKGN